MAKASILSKLTLAKKQEMDTLSKELQRRNKLLVRLAEQREMASCMLDGKDCVIYKDKWVTNNETGEREKVQLRKRLKQWYYTANNKLYFEVRYGNKTLELAKGKAAIEVGDNSALLGVIDTVIAAANAGEFDEMLMKVKRVAS